MDNATRSLLERLETTLRSSIDRHAQLFSLLERKRKSLRSGNATLMAELTKLENAQVQTISELEKTRLQLVADLTLRVLPKAPEPLKLAALAEHFPDSTRGRLLVMRAQLLERMRAVQEQTAVARRAGDALLRHVNGLVRTLASVSHGGAAYGPIGRAPQQPAPMSTLSLTA